MPETVDMEEQRNTATVPGSRTARSAEAQTAQDVLVEPELMPRQDLTDQSVENQTDQSMTDEAAIESVMEPILFTATPRRDIEIPTQLASVEPAVLMEIMNFKRVCRDPNVNISGVQFQCRPEVEEDEISHHGHVVYDTRYLNPEDGRIYIQMQNPEMWNRIVLGRLRLHRLTTENGPLDGMYYWGLSSNGVPTDKITRLADATSETEGAVLEAPEESFVVGG